MIDTNLEMTDKIGYLLFKKGIIDSAILEKALTAKATDNSKIKRNLAQILVMIMTLSLEKLQFYTLSVNWKLTPMRYLHAGLKQLNR
jgi:hypothetical protein